MLKEMFFSTFAGGRDAVTKVGCEKLVPMLLKIVANVSDEAALFVVKWSHYMAYGLGIAIESGLVIYSIRKAIKQREEGIHIKTDEEFYVKIVEIIAKAFWPGKFRDCWLAHWCSGCPCSCPGGKLNRWGNWSLRCSLGGGFHCMGVRKSPLPQWMKSIQRYR